MGEDILQGARANTCKTTSTTLALAPEYLQKHLEPTSLFLMDRSAITSAAGSTCGHSGELFVLLLLYIVIISVTL